MIGLSSLIIILRQIVFSLASKGVREKPKRARKKQISRRLFIEIP